LAPNSISWLKNQLVQTYLLYPVCAAPFTGVDYQFIVRNVPTGAVVKSCSIIAPGSACPGGPSDIQIKSTPTASGRQIGICRTEYKDVRSRLFTHFNPLSCKYFDIDWHVEFQCYAQLYSIYQFFEA
jgi:hypothetical protein